MVFARQPNIIALMLALLTMLSGAVTADETHEAQFLVAAPSLADPTFARTVILLLGHDDEGALGIIVNRPTSATIARVFPHIDHATKRSDRLYRGGPVQPKRIFILLRADEPPPAAESVLPGVYVSTRQQTFDHVLTNEWPESQFRVVAGYAGWGAGQLDNEVDRGDWQFHPASEPALFDVPAEHLWDALTAQSRGHWVFAQDVPLAR